ncbi:hypothetical protein OLZ33_00435 [Pantoea ananatis]|uniref:hypothetical protein n=1 Tax=Pantoea ananas TaxID=553 RepID=UPI00158EEA1D|nr:hypothetical protein [Pantoea ananatis]MBA4820141.1 hypothetical protein [Pantoea ananatis]MCW1830473.1 hypothetical protein [Pantoea ananatis]QKV90111.1 hypothetical protein FOB88_24790 [Pantoea ananatis]
MVHGNLLWKHNKHVGQSQNVNGTITRDAHGLELLAFLLRGKSSIKYNIEYGVLRKQKGKTDIENNRVCSNQLIYIMR